MFSSTTMELSTSMPMASAMPPRVSTLSVRPEKYMKMRAHSTENGMEKATTSVGRTDLRNSASTTTASSAPMSSDCRMLPMYSSM